MDRTAPVMTGGGRQEDLAALDELVTLELAPELVVVRPLGRGSMASVYLAREVALDRLVAIKVLAPSRASDDTARRRFEREARSAARIRHRNVTAVYHVHRLSNGLPYLVMEYVDGRNLEDALAATGPLPVDEARDLLIQLASGLAAAHESGIIHRDLKPANILRESATGRVVLTDFGVAAVRDSAGTDTTRLTMQGQVLGQLGYVSPEHLMGEELTELADIYAFGVVGYEILTGRGPYESGSAAALTTAHLSAPPTPLASLRPGVDSDLARLLERCLAKKPEHRPRAADIVAALEDRGEGTGPEPRPEPETAFDAFLEELKRRRVYRVAVAYLAVGLAAIGGASDISDALPVPEWAAAAIVVAVLAGFPVTLALAWMFDVRSGRITRTEESTGSISALGRGIPAAALGLMLALAALLAWWLL